MNLSQNQDLEDLEDEFFNEAITSDSDSESDYDLYDYENDDDSSVYNPTRFYRLNRDRMYNEDSLDDYLEQQISRSIQDDDDYNCDYD